MAVERVDRTLTVETLEPDECGIGEVESIHREHRDLMRTSATRRLLCERVRERRLARTGRADDAEKYAPRGCLRVGECEHPVDEIAGFREVEAGHRRRGISDATGAESMTATVCRIAASALWRTVRACADDNASPTQGPAIAERTS
ncbi:hypothetical protein GCM10027415_09330 [Humibacter ginsengisoli]